MVAVMVTTQAPVEMQIALLVFGHLFVHHLFQQRL